MGLGVSTGESQGWVVPWQPAFPTLGRGLASINITKDTLWPFATVSPRVWGTESIGQRPHPYEKYSLVSEQPKLYFF